jgi:hypothetical protein
LGQEDVLAARAIWRISNVDGGEPVAGESVLNLCSTAEPERRVGPHRQAVRGERVRVSEGNVRQRDPGDLSALLDIADARNGPDDRAGLGGPVLPGTAFWAPGLEYEVAPAAQRASNAAQRRAPAILVDAPPEEIWPWLTQMGWHLGGYYTPGWVDWLLFPQNWPSLHHLDPALMRDLEVGDTIPDGAPGTAWYVVTEVDAPHTLVLRSTTHLPPGWRDGFGATAARRVSPATATLRQTPVDRRRGGQRTTLFPADCTVHDGPRTLGPCRRPREAVRAAERIHTAPSSNSGHAGGRRAGTVARSSVDAAGVVGPERSAAGRCRSAAATLEASAA